MGWSTVPERHLRPPLPFAITVLLVPSSPSRPSHCPAKLHEQRTEIWGWTAWPRLQEGRLKLGHLKNELRWVKPAGVAMCPEVEHLLSPRPVCVPRASVGRPRRSLGLRERWPSGHGAPGRGTQAVTGWLTWGLLQGDCPPGQAWGQVGEHWPRGLA